jgi:Spy/CpxP family protein refolding chaperone
MPHSRFVTGCARTGALALIGLFCCGARASSALAADDQRGSAAIPAAPAAPPSQQPTPTGRDQGPAGLMPRGQGRTEFLWWNDDAIKKELGLTSTQVARINDIYQKRLADVRPFADELTKQQAELDRMVADRKVDETVISLQAARVEAWRSPINQSRIVMLYRIYRVLTVKQNEQLRLVLERLRGRGGH